MEVETATSMPETVDDAAVMNQLEDVLYPEQDEQNEEATQEQVLEEEEITEEDDKEEKEETSDEEQEEEAEELGPEEIAQLLGMKAEAVSITDDGQLLINTNVKGKITPASLDDLVKSYQLESALTQKSMAIAEEKKAIETQLVQYNQQMTAKLEEATALAGFMDQQINAEFTGIDWDHLRAADPAEFAAKQMELTGKQSQLQQLKQQIAGNAQELNNQRQAVQGQRLQETLQAESEKLVTAIPGWQNAETATKELDEVNSALVANYGFNEAEVGNVFDHRLILVARDAMLYRQGKKAADVTTKRVRKIPKLVKSSAVKSKQSQNAAAIKKKQTRLRRTGSVKDAAAVLVDLI